MAKASEGVEITASRKYPNSKIQEPPKDETLRSLLLGTRVFNIHCAYLGFTLHLQYREVSQRPKAWMGKAAEPGQWGWCTEQGLRAGKLGVNTHTKKAITEQKGPESKSRVPFFL